MIGGAINPLRGFSALIRALEYFEIHFAIVLVAAIIATGLSWAKLGKTAPAEGMKAWIAAKSTSSLAFGLLGFAVAYLLSFGVDKNGSVNSLFSMVATPLLPILIGGITFLETPGTAAAAAVPPPPGTTPPDPKPRTGMIVFLITFVLCYQTLYFQISHLWPG